MAIAWPLSGRITSPFGDRTNRSSPHSGTDIYGANGTAIKAGASGKVHFAAPHKDSRGRLKPSGNVVTIQYQVPGGTLTAMYCHVENRYPVSVGSQVKNGQVIAYVGSSGNSQGGHTHIECYLNGRLVNPENYFKGTVSAGSTPVPIPVSNPATSQESNMDMIHETKRVVDVPGKSGVRHATWKDENTYLVYTDTWYEEIVGAGALANQWARITGHSSRKVQTGDIAKIKGKIDSLPKPTQAPAVELTQADLVKIADLVADRVKVPTQGTISLS